MRLGLFLLLISAAVAVRAETVLVLGDSLSAAYNIPLEDGWVRLLERRLAAGGCGVEVVNASISGETSLGGLNRLPKLLKDHQPSVVIVELGGNDGLRGFSPDSLYDNLRAIVTRAQAAGARVVLTGIRVPTNYGARYGEQFAGVYERVAAERGVPLVPFLLDGVALDPEMIQADGVHPTAAAQPRILDNLMPLLASQLTGCESRTALPSPVASAEPAPVDGQHREMSAERARRAEGAITALAAEGFIGSVLIAHGDRPIWERDVGFDPAPGAAPSYWVASITKQFVAAAILLLEQRGQLDIHDPILDYLPGIPADKVGITIFQLLTHTSGLSQAYAADGIDDRNLALEALLRPPLAHPPGSAFAYANDNYNILAILLETVAGVPYEEFLRHELFEPAGMVHSASWAEPVEKGSMVPALATPFSNGDPDAKANWGFKGATGARASVGDLFSWVRALRSEQILSRRSVDQLMGSHWVLPSGTAVGFNWFSAPSAVGMVRFTRGQESFGCNAVIYWYPEQDLTIIAATNAGPAETGDGPVQGWSRRAHSALAEILVEQ